MTIRSLWRFFPVVLAVFPFVRATTAFADDPTPLASGLAYQTYASNGGSPSFPLPSDEPLSSGVVNGLNFDWGGGEILDSGRSEGVIVRFDGYLSPDEPKTYYLCGLADDGFLLEVDGQVVINDWWDKGPSCGNTGDLDFSDGQPKQITIWFYENGGGAVAQLMYFTDAGNWLVAPNSWFSNAPSVTTTTSTTTTTLPNFLGTPTNVQVSDTGEGIVISWSAASDDSGVSPERYSVSWSTDSSGWGVATGNVGDENALNTQMILGYELFESTGGLETEYQFTVRADNDSSGVYSANSEPFVFTVGAPVPPSTTTIPDEPKTTTEPPVTTTEPVAPPSVTTNPQPEPTVPEPEDTAPPEQTVPDTAAPEPTIPDTQPEPTPDPEPVPEQQPEEQPEEPSLEPSEPEQEPEPTPEPEPEPEETPEAEPELTPETIDDPESLATLIESTDLETASNNELVSLLSSPAFSEIDPDLAISIIDEIQFDELTEEETAEVVAALNTASDAVKEHFEEEVNVYSGQFDEYQPSGSQITVGQRRVVVAVTVATSVMTPAPVAGSSRRKS